jgi:hypothetical protein
MGGQCVIEHTDTSILFIADRTRQPLESVFGKSVASDLAQRAIKDYRSRRASYAGAWLAVTLAGDAAEKTLLPRIPSGASKPTSRKRGL